MYTIKSSVHIFLFSSQTPQKINNPTNLPNFCFPWNEPMAIANGLPPRQKRGPCNAHPGQRLMFSWLRFHSNDGDLHLRFDGLEFLWRTGPKLLCWEKIGLNVGHFQMSKICMFQEHFQEQDDWMLLYRSGKCPYINLTRTCMSLWHLPLCISHFFQANDYIQPSNHSVVPNAQLQETFPWKKRVVE